MATEVLLMAVVADLGAEGDVVTVSDGYARNCLYPQKLAAPVTSGTRRKLAKLQQMREARLKVELGDAAELAKRIRNVSCTIVAKAGEEGKLFGSVSASDIVDNLKGQGFAIDKQLVKLDEHIKELGVYTVKIKLHPEVEAEIKVWVVEEGSKA